MKQIKYSITGISSSLALVKKIEEIEKEEEMAEFGVIKFALQSVKSEAHRVVRHLTIYIQALGDKIGQVLAISLVFLISLQNFAAHVLLLEHHIRFIEERGDDVGLVFLNVLIPIPHILSSDGCHSSGVRPLGNFHHGTIYCGMLEMC